MYEVLAENGDGTVGFRLGGKLTRQDLQGLRLLLEGALERFPSLRVLVILDRVQGIETGALLRDLEPAARHLPRLGRVAVVGGGEWEGWWDAATARFAPTDLPDPAGSRAAGGWPEVRFFASSQTEAAWLWVRSRG
ncbi:MAG: STAS/SEC14 domain-containing protein [Deferrisomatales bacterium]|nr:STAS/SEC14 domain-containing protein [Deferrisomatales bacterium]